MTCGTTSRPPPPSPPFLLAASLGTHTTTHSTQTGGATSPETAPEVTSSLCPSLVSLFFCLFPFVVFFSPLITTPRRIFLSLYIYISMCVVSVSVARCCGRLRGALAPRTQNKTGRTGAQENLTMNYRFLFELFSRGSSRNALQTSRAAIYERRGWRTTV